MKTKWEKSFQFQFVFCNVNVSPMNKSVSTDCLRSRTNIEYCAIVFNHFMDLISLDIIWQCIINLLSCVRKSKEQYDRLKLSSIEKYIHKYNLGCSWSVANKNFISNSALAIIFVQLNVNSGSLIVLIVLNLPINFFNILYIYCIFRCTLIVFDIYSSLDSSICVLPTRILLKFISSK